MASIKDTLKNDQNRSCLEIRSFHRIISRASMMRRCGRGSHCTDRAEHNSNSLPQRCALNTYREGEQPNENRNGGLHHGAQEWGCHLQPVHETKRVKERARTNKEDPGDLFRARFNEIDFGDEFPKEQKHACGENHSIHEEN